MRVPTRTQDRGFAVNITPLIDVVFLLIIFFLVASHFIRHEHVERIELPIASKAQEDEESPNRLIVTIVASGEMSIGTTPIPPEEFEQRLQALIAKHGTAATELRIRADRSVLYSNVEPMLITAAQNGVTKVRFAVLKP
jgi:biopolymer transport protein ExbD